ncbi:hypothetical protein ATK74_1247 [Propionicimonas paludicola]|uniref:Uncharacterized protein n=1 Tax=Propionicimonas paludicola TaxID=185243 RepID=A0A2A9CRI2_9ACTN|nr:hypothetical protein [Propionicimonas paludicola]PFG16695.1 hypothetical protein ATK74_1247 [Propionicimonas paludicola]
MKATLATAVIERGATEVLAGVMKLCEGGERLEDLTSEDWVGIAGDTGFGLTKVGV